MPRHSFELFGDVDHVTKRRIALINVCKHLVFAHGAVNGHADGKGHVFGNAVHLGVGKTHDTSNIADGLSCRHRAKGHDLRHMVFAVFFGYIFDDLAAALVAEIHVKIGHAHALRVEKTLKQKSVFYRVDVGNAKCERCKAACTRTASGADRNALTLGMRNKIVDNEVIFGVSHAGDHVKFIG